MPAYIRNRVKPNSGEHIRDIIVRTICLKHQALKGMPCFNVKFDTKDAYGPAICNDRVVKAGFVGTITSDSTRKQRPDTKRPQSRRHTSSQ